MMLKKLKFHNFLTQALDQDMTVSETDESIEGETASDQCSTETEGN